MQYLLDSGANLHGGQYYNINEETVPLYQYLAERWIRDKNADVLSILKRNALFIYEKFGVEPDPEFARVWP